MAQGKGSAVILAAAVMVLTVVVFHGRVAEAATYTVGGGNGWAFSVSGWPQGKHFVAGDVLVFNYNPTYHNVVEVTEAGYNGCTTSPGAKVYQSGKDQITLVKGQNFFICNFRGHCESGMKIAVNAA